jgi:hypothetical protein
MKTNGASEGEKARGTTTKEAKFRAHLQVAHKRLTAYHLIIQYNILVKTKNASPLTRKLTRNCYEEIRISD